MSDSDRTDLDTLNEAAKAIAAELFDTGLEHVSEYAAKYNIRESDIPLVLANAYLRVAALTNASCFGLDANELACRFNEAMKNLPRE